MLKSWFRPELLNRIDEIITFKPLTKNQIGKIVELLLENVRKRLEVKQIALEISKEATEQIIEQGYDVSFGARPLKRFIQANIETMIAKSLLSNEIKPKSTIVVDYDNEEFIIKIK